jgi:hypothetical protein
MLDLPVAKVSSVETALRYVVKVPFITIWGLPGVGKSSIIGQWCRYYGLNFLPISLTHCQPEDLAGYPYIDKETGAMMFALPSWLLDALSSEKPTVVLIDEANDARRDVLAAMQRLFDYFLHSAYLSKALSCKSDKLNIKNVRFVLSANPPGISMNSTPLTPALCNRSLHFQVTPDQNRSDNYLVNADNFNEFPFLLGPEAEYHFDEHEFIETYEYPDAQTMHQNFLTAKRLIVAFRRAQPNHFYRYEPTKIAYPTPRSWELCAFAMSIHNPFDLQAWELVASASVGIETATALVVFLRDVKIPPVEDIIAQPEILKPFLSPERVDIAAAAAGAICDVVSKMGEEDFVKFVQGSYTKIVAVFEDAFLSDVAQRIRRASARKALEFGRHELAETITQRRRER